MVFQLREETGDAYGTAKRVAEQLTRMIVGWRVAAHTRTDLVL